jgi:RNA polymerase sigma-70 factor (ECF subfamily)
MDQKHLFQELLRANSGRWRAIARSYAGRDEDDLFQEILLQIWKSLATFEGKSALGTWCYRVALNSAMSWRRATRTRRERLPVRDGYSLSLIPSPNGQPEPSDVLQRVMAELSAADRAILVLLLDGVGYAEMAEILGATEGSLRVRVHRLKQRIAGLSQGIVS